MIKDLNSEQKKALKTLLNTTQNVYLTGAGGTGKSHIIKLFREIKKLQQQPTPIVASTGAAALLVNGVTFNSYFGLGIMAGGLEQTITTALASRSVCERLIYTDCIVIDEISMISSTTFKAANLLCQKVRQNKKPFGGIRLICVGDFLQLGPYSETEFVDWIFNGKCWKESKVKKIELIKVMRTTESAFLKILNKVRFGKVDKEVENFLNKKIIKKGISDFEGARIFSRNYEVDTYNEKKLKELTTPLVLAKTLYVGEAFAIGKMKDNLVVPENLYLKKGALVMMRVNNFQEGYINGTLGHIVGISPDILTIKKLSGETIQVKKHVFEFLDGSGEVIAKAKNFPLSLAWAVTIHKAQGATLDRALISIDRLWLHGQAYTALSRLKTEKGLFIEKWDKKSFIVDKKVLKFIKTK
jgi:ATP-dependent exoDNAse (exonuclease V) alpha subunit